MARAAGNVFKIHAIFLQDFLTKWPAQREILLHPPPAEMLRCLRTVRRLLHPPPAEMCAMLKNGTTLIQFPPRQEVCDAYLRRRQFPSDE